VVVQDIFLSESAQLAHVVLPAAASLEKDGTFTNTERRVQHLHPVIVPPPGEARPDWQITGALGEKLDEALGRAPGQVRWRFHSTAEIAQEAAAVTPIYGGILHHRLGDGGLVWPCPTPEHPGTPILHTERFSRGLGKFHAVQAILPAEPPDAEYPLILSTGRVLYHYHTGTMSRRSVGLDWREPRGYVEVNPADAAAHNLRDGGPVVIHSRRGQVRTQARFSDRVQPGVIFFVLPLERSARQRAHPRLRAGPAGEDPGVQGVGGAAGESEPAGIGSIILPRRPAACPARSSPTACCASWI
jgi:formate dehydrogenase major subunit